MKPQEVVFGFGWPSILISIRRLREKVSHLRHRYLRSENRSRIHSNSKTFPKSLDRAIVAIDVGTSSIKSAFWFVDRGHVLGPKANHDLDTHYDENGTCITQKVSDWYSGTIRVLQHLVATEPNVTIVAISVTGQMQDLIAVGDDKPSILKEHAIMYADHRAQREANQLSQVLGAEIQATSLLAKLRYMKDDEERGQGSRRGDRRYQFLFGAADYITYSLSAQPKPTVTDATTVSTTGLSSAPRHRDYDHSILQRCKLDGLVTSFPKILNGPQVIGQLSAEIAVEIGIQNLHQIAIIHAGGDAFSATVGAGCMVGSKKSYVYAGTSGWVGATLPWKSVTRHDASGLLWLGHARDDTLNILVASVASVGGSLRLMSKLFMGCEEADLDVMAEKANIGASGVIFVPYINGRRCPTPTDRTTGGFYGIRGDTTKEHCARAIIEGVLFSVIEAREQLVSHFDVEPPSVLVGGVSKSRIFVEGLEVLSGSKHITVGGTDVGLHGAAIVATDIITQSDYIDKNTSKQNRSHVQKTPLRTRQEWEESFSRWKHVVAEFEIMWTKLY